MGQKRTWEREDDVDDDDDVIYLAEVPDHLHPHHLVVLAAVRKDDLGAVLAEPVEGAGAGGRDDVVITGQLSKLSKLANCQYKPTVKSVKTV